MTNELEGKVALVTGASRGIGRAIALRLGGMGATVAVHYNSAEVKAREVVEAIEAGGAKAFAVRADLGDRGGADELVAQLDKELEAATGSNGLDILVNNAGTGTRNTIEQVTEEEFDHVIQVDLRSPFFLIQKCLARMRDGGRIVNVSSMGTRAAYPAMAAYAPAKAGLEALTLLLAAHLGPRNITVNAVLPGATATDFHPGAQDPVMSKQIAQTIALGRVGQPEDIADIVAFLASDKGRWVTAQKIDASGGQRI
ncbi:SDR family oxidoreductase [Microbaculum marinum]|uniref:SDR family oxidoreductase n=1 Tax=Microbaculum marinum TaxID=1764581 RepID=A0AAW9RJZ1_9HYPH